MASYSVDFNLLPYKRDFSILQGDGIEWPLTLQLNGSAMNLSSVTLTYAVNTESGTSVIASTSMTADAAAAGQVTFRIKASQTSTWSGEYRYEAQCVWPSGHSSFSSGATKTLLAGRITATTDIA